MNLVRVFAGVCTLLASFGLQALPPESIQQDNVRHTNQIIWLDLVTDKYDSSAKFYGGLFGWKFKQFEDRPYYHITNAEGKDIGGVAVQQSRSDQQPETHWMPFFSTNRLKAEVTIALAAGASEVVAPKQVNNGDVAILRDQQGALFGLTHATKGDPKLSENGFPQGWAWMDLLTPDVAVAVNFYQAVFGYQIKAVKGKDGIQYTLFVQSSGDIGGLVQLKNSISAAYWLPFLWVESVDAMAKKAKNLGATINYNEGHVAILTDPNGGIIGLQERPVPNGDDMQAVDLKSSNYSGGKSK